MVAKAEKKSSRRERSNVMDSAGLCHDDYEFVNGRLIENFALSNRFIPGIDWLHGCSQDNMHTSFCSGPVPQEGYLLIYTFIRIRKYFSRADLNSARLQYEYWPPGHMVPLFDKYVEEGVKGTLPDPSAKLHFTAAQSRCSFNFMKSQGCALDRIPHSFQCS